MDKTIVGIAVRDIGKGQVVSYDDLASKQVIFNKDYVENIIKEKDAFERVSNELARTIERLEETIDNNMLLIKMLREEVSK